MARQVQDPYDQDLFDEERGVFNFKEVKALRASQRPRVSKLLLQLGEHVDSQPGYTLVQKEQSGSPRLSIEVRKLRSNVEKWLGSDN